MLDVLDQFQCKTVNTAKKQSKKRKRKPINKQAKQKNGKVEILCKKCRKSRDNMKQTSLDGWFKKRKTDDSTPKKIPVQEKEDEKNVTGRTDLLLCNRCRVPMVVKSFSLAKPSSYKGCPFSVKLKRYKKTAADSEVDFMLTDREACRLMREPCSACKSPAPVGVGHGLSRLGVWPEGVEPKRSMGPYWKKNVIAMCSMCNLMKGARGLQSFVEMCMHISTHKGRGNFGLFPERFRNNISKRNRSSYLTDTKTFSLTNEQFRALVQKPCYYCGKESDPPNHYNGLDRLDSSKRVYKEGSVVSCCGDCNCAKYRFSEEEFLDQCLRIASAHQNKQKCEKSDVVKSNETEL